MLGMAQRRPAEQRVDRCEPVVSGANAVSPDVFELVQEGTDECSVEIAEVETAGLGAGPLGGEGEQEAEGVSVSGDGVRAGSALADQPVGEECLECRGKRRHGLTPNRPS